MRRFLLAAALCLIIGLLGGLLMLAVEPSAAPARYRFVPPREAAFDFSLADQDGKPQSIKSARGNVLAIRPSQRKTAVVLFTFFCILGLVLTFVGIFFRGPGYTFVIPFVTAPGVYFSL